MNSRVVTTMKMYSVMLRVLLEKPEDFVSGCLSLKGNQSYANKITVGVGSSFFSAESKRDHECSGKREDS